MRRLSSALALCALLAPLPAAGPAAAEGLLDMSAAEKDAFNAAVRDYLVANPEVLVEAMNVLQSRQAEAEAALDDELVVTHASALFDDGHSWVGGNPEGDVTIVEFMDYRCGYCRKAYSEVEELVRADGNIRFIVKEYPILGPDSTISSQFAVAVQLMADEAVYKKAHDALITLRGNPDEATLARLAGDLGLEPAAVAAKMQTPEVAAILAENANLGEAMSITGTPTFVIGGQMLRGYVPLEGMQELVGVERGEG